MARITDLDIPSGLEDLYNYVLSVLFDATAAGFKKRPSAGDAKKRAIRRGQSLFLLWQSLYDGFDGTRKGKWTTYWGTLPFGGHTGAGGWPGSGYSAFVYVNAPRYKNGEDLLLDPPGGYGPELILNGDFAGNADNWILDAGDDAFLYADGVVYVDYPALNDAYLQQVLPLDNEANFHLTFNAAIDTDTPGDFLMPLDIVSANGGTGFPHIADLEPNGGVLTPYEFDFFCYLDDPDDTKTLQFAVLAGAVQVTVTIDDVSLKQIL